jgi:hypothetical protein
MWSSLFYIDYLNITGIRRKTIIKNIQFPMIYNEEKTIDARSFEWCASLKEN